MSARLRLGHDGTSPSASHSVVASACAKGRAKASLVRPRRDEVTPQYDAHARDPSLRCHDGSFSRIQGGDPL
eukprot:1296113-Heterocapsa_arctica.AAC.1